MSLPIQEIAKLYDEGWSMYEISEKYNTYPNKILRLLKKFGIKTRKRSEATKFAISRGRKQHPTAGKCRTDEEKLKISDGMEKFYQQLDQKSYNKIIRRAKQQWKKIPKHKLKVMQAKSAESNRIAAKEGSAVEKYVKETLEENKILVDFHKKGLMNTELEIDIFLPKLNMVIEIDGPSHFKPIWGQQKLEEQIKFDNEKTGIILNLGLVLLRVKYLRSRLTLGVKNKLKIEILKIIEKIKVKLPPKNKRLIEIEV